MNERTGPQEYRIVVEESHGRWAWRIVNQGGSVLCRGEKDYSLRKSATEAAENCIITLRGAKVRLPGALDGKPSYSGRGKCV